MKKILPSKLAKGSEANSISPCEPIHTIESIGTTDRAIATVHACLRLAAVVVRGLHAASQVCVRTREPGNSKAHASPWLRVGAKAKSFKQATGKGKSFATGVAIQDVNCLEAT